MSTLTYAALATLLYIPSMAFLAWLITLTGWLEFWPSVLCAVIIDIGYKLTK